METTYKSSYRELTPPLETVRLRSTGGGKSGSGSRETIDVAKPAPTPDDRVESERGRHGADAAAAASYDETDRQIIG